MLEWNNLLGGMVTVIVNSEKEWDDAIREGEKKNLRLATCSNAGLHGQVRLTFFPNDEEHFNKEGTPDSFPFNDSRGMK